MGTSSKEPATLRELVRVLRPYGLFRVKWHWSWLVPILWPWFIWGHVRGVVGLWKLDGIFKRVYGLHLSSIVPTFTALQGRVPRKEKR